MQIYPIVVKKLLKKKKKKSLKITLSILNKTQSVLPDKSVC